jgi:hypothetical protein
MMDDRKSAGRRIPVMSIVVALCLLALWEAFARNGFISPIVAPAPSRIITALIAELRSGDLGLHMIATVMRLSVGLLVGRRSEFLLDSLWDCQPGFAAFADPFVAAAHPIPKIAILPIVMVFLGIGELSKMAMVALSVVLPAADQYNDGSPPDKSGSLRCREELRRDAMEALHQSSRSGEHADDPERIAYRAQHCTRRHDFSRDSDGIARTRRAHLAFMGDAPIEVLYARLVRHSCFGIFFNLLTQFLVARLFRGLRDQSLHDVSFVPKFLSERINRSALRSIRKRGSRVDRFKLAERSRVRATLLDSPDIARAVEAHAAAHGLSREKVWKLVRRYIDEIVPFFNILAYYRFGYLSSRAVLNTFYKVSAVHHPAWSGRQLPRDAIVVYLMNHRSNADYVLVGYVLSGRVAISYAVGEWARAFPLEYIFKSFGSVLHPAKVSRARSTILCSSNTFS